MPSRKKWTELEKIGQRIREARERLGMSQGELAERIGKTQEAISSYETAIRAVHLSDLPLLAKALNIPLGYLFGYEYPETEAMDLVSRLTLLPTDYQRIVTERWRYELEWWTHLNEAGTEVTAKVTREYKNASKKE